MIPPEDGVVSSNDLKGLDTRAGDAPLDDESPSGLKLTDCVDPSASKVKSSFAGSVSKE
jgi:hypothetical protein